MGKGFAARFATGEQESAALAVAGFSTGNGRFPATTEMNDETEILVIGAGISGLLAARTLQEAGLRVLLVDKGRSVGGRMATRRIGPGQADHGAQFFTVRADAFRALVAQWQADGLAYVWSYGWSDGSLAGKKSEDGHPRYAIHGGMNRLCKQLAQGLEVRLQTEVARLSATPNGWQAETKGGERLISRALLLTAPVPQALALLAAGGTQLAAAEQMALAQVAYAPCLCALIWVQGEVYLPEPGALQRPLHPISWIANNQRKGISPAATIVTMHANPSFSQTHYNAPEQETLAQFVAALRPHLADTALIQEAQLKKWRYALPTLLYPARTLLAQSLPPLAFAGDAFLEARVEGAVLSGLAAAQALIGCL